MKIPFYGKKSRDSIVKDRVDGMYLLQETGVEGDKLILDDLDIEREGRLYGTAHELFAKIERSKTRLSSIWQARRLARRRKERIFTKTT